MSGEAVKERVTPVPNYLRISVLEVRNARHAVCNRSLRFEKEGVSKR